MKSTSDCRCVQSIRTHGINNFAIVSTWRYHECFTFILVTIIKI